MHDDLLLPIRNFLAVTTPGAWINEASKPEHLPLLLIDHLLCELKAGQSAMYLIRKYAVEPHSANTLLEWFRPYEEFAYRQQGSLASLQGKNAVSKAIKARKDSPYSQELIDKMVLLIKEELHHFYQVLEIIQSRGISYHPINASRYAKGLLKHMRTYEPEALVDKLIIGAFIEARSCERFAALATHVDEKLSKFYISLLRSEARHYQDYLALASQISARDISDRISYFAAIEAELITTPDHDFRFHSGIPA